MDEYITIILNDLKRARIHHKGNGVDVYNKQVHDKYKEALRFLEIENIIKLSSERKYELLVLGKEVIKNNNDWKKTIEDNNLNKSIEFEKSKIDFELAKETLNEFPNTKRRAKIAYIIAIILAFVQIVQWIIELLPRDLTILFP